ncbi:S8 family peptidase [Microbacterium sp.]|uniref:S8 family peptidase n=1 Tax=Microbacterium sp. TaxID=51671 RepID=UPI0039E26615
MARLTDDEGSGLPGRTWRDREAAARRRGVVLDPSLASDDEGELHATVYEPDVLLVYPPEGTDGSDVVRALGEIAGEAGWSVAEEPLADPPRSGRARADRLPALPSAARTVRVRIQPSADASGPERRPDAWQLLRAARRRGIAGVTLNHVLSIGPFTGNPFTGNPFTGNPFTGNPFTGNPFTGNAGGMSAYALPGFGGRQPVVYTGPRPPRTDMAPGARPVVAVLDTGCGIHSWLDGDVLVTAPELGGTIGIDDPVTDPETNPSLGDPLDGVLDAAAGHGTFIAGIVRQACPDVRILPVRVSDGQGVILEKDLLAALGQLVALLEGGTRIDVINLSLGYYHESAGSVSSIDGELYDLLARARRAGCVVVCSAGNDATDRPSSPAALYAWKGEDCVIKPEDEKGLAPHVVVGALNPSGASVALFSNVGPWVRTYARGVSVVSTMPEFEAAVQGDLSDVDYGRLRETLDIDDFRGGFGVWSGTSFAAPLVAGRIAAQIAASKGVAAAGIEAIVAAAVAEIDDEDHSRTT